LSSYIALGTTIENRERQVKNLNVKLLVSHHADQSIKRADAISPRMTSHELSILLLQVGQRSSNNIIFSTSKTHEIWLLQSTRPRMRVGLLQPHRHFFKRSSTSEPQNL
jgi:hypothetical protein